MILNLELNNLKRILYFLTGGTLLWLLLMVLAPFLKSLGVGIAEYFYFLFEPVCHQIPERSLFINSEPMAVCTRCFAIYSGTFVILLLALIRKKILYVNPKVAILLSIPTGIDLLLEKFGLYVNIPEIRIVTGLFFGASIIYLILYSLMDIKNEQLNKQKVIYGKSEIN